MKTLDETLRLLGETVLSIDRRISKLEKAAGQDLDILERHLDMLNDLNERAAKLEAAPYEDGINALNERVNHIESYLEGGFLPVEGAPVAQAWEGPHADDCLCDPCVTADPARMEGLKVEFEPEQPSPWSVAETDEGYEIVHNRSGRTIAKIVWPGWSPRTAANFVAAAPDMLKALKVAAAGRWSFELSGQIDAAIAKAEGRG